MVPDGSTLSPNNKQANGVGGKHGMIEFAGIASGLRFPEGPVAMEDGSVLVCEIAGERLTRVTADGRHQEITRLAGGPNGAAIAAVVFLSNLRDGIGCSRDASSVTHVPAGDPPTTNTSFAGRDLRTACATGSGRGASLRRRGRARG